jgi:hypothetical protein
MDTPSPLRDMDEQREQGQWSVERIRWKEACRPPVLPCAMKLPARCDRTDPVFSDQGLKRGINKKRR